MKYTLKPLRPTKELILNKISEERIMEHYLGIHVKKGLVKSPLRKDNNPTCSFYRNKHGTLIFHDFSGHFSGDAFSVVMYKYNCDFYKALQIIANDFDIIKIPDIQINPPLIKYSDNKLEQNKTAIIQVEIRDFQQYELDWWMTYGITEKTLKKFNVFSCKNVFLNGNLFKLESEGQKIFGYYGGIKDGMELWRIYQANKIKYKFISNWPSSKIQGMKQLPKTGDVLIVQKAMKDIMCLYEFGIPSIAPNSENTSISDEEIAKLKERFKRIIFWYDNDEAGITNLNKIKEKYPEFEYYYIPENYNVKDFSDFRKKYGKEKSQLLLDSILYESK